MHSHYIQQLYLSIPTSLVLVPLTCKSTMESIHGLFSPKDTIISRGGHVVDTEVLLTRSFDDLLNHRDCTWDWFLAFFRRTVLWISPGVFLATAFARNKRSFESFFPHKLTVEIQQANTSVVDTFYIHSGSTDYGEQVLSTCDFLIRLTPENTTSHFRLIKTGVPGAYFPLPAPIATLSRLMVESHGCFEEIELVNLILEEESLRLLATANPDLSMKIKHCTIPDAAGPAFIDCLQLDRGPTELVCCNLDVDADTLATALRGNHHLKSLSLFTILGNAWVRTIGPALAENLGLLKLIIPVALDNAWLSVCSSIQEHPTLMHLDISGGRARSMRWPRLSNEQKMLRTGALVDMVQVNTVLHTIYLDMDEIDSHIFHETIRPRLRENFYRSKLRTVSEAHGTLLRAKLLRHALVRVANYPELVQALLWENQEVAFAAYTRRRH
jgi:hypothetical protein